MPTIPTASGLSRKPSMEPNTQSSGSVRLGWPATRRPTEKHIIIVRIEARIVGNFTKLANAAVVNPAATPAKTLTIRAIQGEPVLTYAMPPRMAESPKPPSAVKSGNRKTRNDRYTPIVMTENNRVVSRVYSNCTTVEFIPRPAFLLVSTFRESQRRTPQSVCCYSRVQNDPLDEWGFRPVSSCRSRQLRPFRRISCPSRRN